MTVVDNLTPALKSAWHPVAMSHELRDEPLQVWLFGEPWVVVRLRGEAVAFQDRCPHRLAPLSAGCIDADQLRCGYHGWTFGPDGRCTAIPALGATDHLPSRARLRKPWGLVERYGLIWLAPAEPVAAIPHWPEWNADGCDRMWNEPRRTPVSAAQLVDNFLDAAHFPFVHRATFGTDEAAQVANEPVTREGWVVRTTFDTWYRDFDDPSVASGEHPEVQQQRLLKQGSASYTVLLRLMFPVTGATFSILFCCQPETATSTRIYKLFTRDDLDGDVDRIDATVKTELRILDEDLDILERYEHMHIHLDQTECHTRADRLSVIWRQLLADLIALSGVTHSMR